jgi:hypothetical protein
MYKSNSIRGLFWFVSRFQKWFDVDISAFLSQTQFGLLFQNLGHLFQSSGHTDSHLIDSHPFQANKVASLLQKVSGNQKDDILKKCAWRK